MSIYDLVSESEEDNVLNMTETQIISKKLKAEKTESVYRLPFPATSFPPPIEKIIISFAQYSNLSVDFIGGGVLAAASIAIGNTHRMKVKKGWTEGANLFLMPVGSPGSGKTPALQFALKPIYEKQKEYNLKYSNALADWKIECTGIPKGEPLPDPPTLEQVIISDATTEAISEVLKDNERGVLIHRDEGIALVKSANQYRGGADEEYFLSAWSHQPITINRKANKERIAINDPFLSFIGGIQPSVLNILFSGKRESNGFVDRILFVCPDQEQANYWSDSELDDKVFSLYKGFINNLFSITSTEVLQFNESGNKEFIQWYNQNTDTLNKQTEDTCKSWYSKLPIHVARLSLIIEMMYYAVGLSDKTYVSGVAVESAIKLAEYFTQSAMVVRNETKPEPNEKAVKAAQMVLEGHSYEHIARTVGVSKGMITKYKKSHPDLFTR